MKTINDFIYDELLDRKMRRELDLNSRIDEVYRQHPKLRDIDNRLIETRCDRIVAIKGGDTEEKLYRTEIKLKDDREKYIKDNGINPSFEEEQPICDKCRDTGFIEKNGGKRVCSCMRSALEECYDYSGMRDYSSISIKGFDSNYFGDGQKRQKLLQTIAGKVSTDTPDKSVIVYMGTALSGKTYLSVCIAKSVISLGKSSFFIKCDDIANLDSDAISTMKECHLLVIDDFSSKCTGNVRTATILAELLEVRAVEHLVTLIVTGEARRSVENDSDIRVASKLLGAEFIGE